MKNEETCHFTQHHTDLAPANSEIIIALHNKVDDDLQCVESAKISEVHVLYR